MSTFAGTALKKVLGGAGSVLAALALPARPARAEEPPLLRREVAAALAQELSGEAAKRNLEELARHNRATDDFASGRPTDWALHAPEGGKEALQAEMVDFTLGSDHQVYTDSSFGVPAIYLNDWPDRYIHTNFDTPANIDPTKLKRAAFIGAASGYLLATLGRDDAPGLWRVVQAAGLRRAARVLERRAVLPAEEAANFVRFHLGYERALVDSLARFLAVPQGLRREAAAHLSALEGLLGETPAAGVRAGRRAEVAPDAVAAVVYRRNAQVKGPVSVFGYDYLEDHYGAERAAALRLLRFQGFWGGGAEYAYEALNFVDGRRTVGEIRDALSAVYGPIPLELVTEYLRALEAAGLVAPETRGC